MSREILLPAINIQYPFGSLILSGEKTIETRTYKIPDSIRGKEILLIETGRPKKIDATRALGIIIFCESFKYVNIESFRKDFAKHKVAPNSVWDWTNEKGKWGWPVQVVEVFNGPTLINGPRGIRFTKSLEVKFL